VPPPPDAGLADGGVGGTDAATGPGGAGNTAAGGGGAGGSTNNAGGSTSPDAGRTRPDAGVDGGSLAAASDKGSCGCRLGRTAPRNGWLVGIAALAWLTARRRTRTNASRHLRTRRTRRTRPTVT
jgi:MYXO-CTERM domain-containing protein